jgi:hypothetical protein
METAFEKILTNSDRPEMESYVIAHPESFAEAIKLAIADKQPYSWRAAWLLLATRPVFFVSDHCKKELSTNLKRYFNRQSFHTFRKDFNFL